MNNLLQHEYIVQRGDNLTKIGRKYGFENPGPIAAFPENQRLFQSQRRSADLIYPGDLLYIPWTYEQLERCIQTSEHLIREVTAFNIRLIQEQIKDKRELEDYMKKIDALNFLAGMGVGIASLTAQGVKGIEMTSKEALVWLLESRATIAGNITTMTVPTPQGPKRDYRFYVRHALGPWNPSFWAEVAMAIKTGDIDIYLYGAGTIAEKTVQKIKRQADKDIQKLKDKINACRTQQAMSFYRKRI